jgi:hypothetical protein
MAEYKIRAAQEITKIGIDFSPPLCMKCKSRDCDNPIELREIALPVVGIKKLKVLVQGRRVSAVRSCEGYIEK